MAKNIKSGNNSTRHVVPHTDGWANKKGGSDRASSVHSTKKEAEAAAFILYQKHDTFNWLSTVILWYLFERHQIHPPGLLRQ